MASPSPNGPTLADLEYNAYNPGGSLNTTAFVPPLNNAVSDNSRLSENVALNFVGYTGTIDTSDFINTAENVQVALGSFGPNLFSITVSDTSTTSEFTDELKAGARFVNTSDSTVTSENTVVTPPA